MMSLKLDDEIFDLLYSFHQTGTIATGMKALIKRNVRELYEGEEWSNFLKEINDGISSYNENSGSNLSIKCESALLLALGMLYAGDESRFDILANDAIGLP